MARGRELGVEHLGVGTILLDLRRECESTAGGRVELPHGATETVRVHVPDLLGKFADLGKPEPEPEPREPAKPISVRQVDEGVDREHEREDEEHRRIRAAANRTLGQDGIAELVEAGEFE